MSRVNVNHLEKVEELPSRIGSRKFIKTYANKSDRDWYRMGYHGESFYAIRSQIMRNSIGKNWDSIVEKIKEKLPEGFVQEHPYIIRRPDIMVQNSVTGYWHWQDEGGRLFNYGYKTPKELKHSVTRDQYYLDKQNRLKFIKSKLKTYKSSRDTKDEIQHENKEKALANYLFSIAEYSFRTHSKYVTSRTIVFKHPTKTDPVKRYDKENNKWIETGEVVPKHMALTIEEFISWAKTHNVTYFIDDKEKYYTNLKWSFKQ